MHKDRRVAGLRGLRSAAAERFPGGHALLNPLARGLCHGAPHPQSLAPRPGVLRRPEGLGTGDGGSASEVPRAGNARQGETAPIAFTLASVAGTPVERVRDDLSSLVAEKRRDGGIGIEGQGPFGHALALLNRHVPDDPFE